MKDKGLILQMVEETFNYSLEDHEKNDFQYSDNKISCLDENSCYEIQLSYEPLKEAFVFSVSGNKFEVPKNWSCFSSLLKLNNYDLVQLTDNDDLIGLVSSITGLNIEEIILIHDQRRVKLTPKQVQIAA